MNNIKTQGLKLKFIFVIICTSTDKIIKSMGESNQSNTYSCAVNWFNLFYWRWDFF